VDEEPDDEEGNEIYKVDVELFLVLVSAVPKSSRLRVEWVEKTGYKPILCSFLKPNGGRREEMRYTFDVSKCDRLFDLLLQGGVIRLTEGHIIPSVDILAKKTYCKRHDSYTHTTNECNYFRR
jgi:hypothetical protein